MVRSTVLVVFLGFASGCHRSSSESKAGETQNATRGDVSPIGSPEPWRWVETDGATCSDGSSAGYAISRVPNARQVFIYLAGGGACWSQTTCYEMRSAVHVDETITADFAIAEAKTLEAYGVVNRAKGAFKDATYVYVPYCTADLHSGATVAHYDTANPAHVLHHTGSSNMAAFVASWPAAVPEATQVYLVGSSAGGYGAMLHYERIAKALPKARVDLLLDGSPPGGPVTDRWEAWKKAWKMQFPEGCGDCAKGFPAVFDSLTQRHPDRRFALLGYEQDAVIATFLGLDATESKARLDDLLAKQFASGNTRYFIHEGRGHVMLNRVASTTSHNVSLATWLDAWANGSSSFVNVR